MRVNLAIVICYILLTLSCHGCSTKEQVHNFPRKFPDDSSGLPIPVFDKNYDEMLGLLQEKFRPENIEMDRPYKVLPDGKFEYWLRITFLNPELPQDRDSGYPLDTFVRLAADETFKHLTNLQQFQSIEIAVRQTEHAYGNINSTVSKFLTKDLKNQTVP